MMMMISKRIALCTWHSAITHTDDTTTLYFSTSLISLSCSSLDQVAQTEPQDNQKKLLYSPTNSVKAINEMTTINNHGQKSRDSTFLGLLHRYMDGAPPTG